MGEILKITGQEFISDILERMPEAGDILSAHGVHCVGCHISAYETLEQGIMGHGMSQKDFENICKDLNDAATDLGIPASGGLLKNPELTEFAKTKILEFQKSQEKEGFGFKIDVLETGGDHSYFLDFLEKPERGDRIVESLGVPLFLSPESLKKLQNCTIDFMETEDGAGFKIEKNN